MMNLKETLVPTLLIISSIGFAACLPPKTQVPKDITLNYGNGETIDGNTNDLQNAQSNSYNLESQTITQNSQGGNMKRLEDFEPIEATQVTLHTAKGDITFELYRDQAPVTTLNFLTLAKEGYYNGILFHRVIPDFMAQAGDPLTKEPSKQAQWGSGGPGYVIPDEFDNNLRHDSAGIVSMANRGPDTGGSQFFITYEATPWLDGKHAIFGKVTSGMAVVEQLENGDEITSVSYQ